MDEDLNFFDDTMAGYDFNPYPSSEVHPRWNNNRYYLRAPESAIYEDGMPGVISPHMEADVSNMQIGESLIEHPGTDNILSDPSHLQAPEHPANTGHSSPWNALYSESGYGNITSEEMFPTARDHNRFLNVPGNPRSRGTGGTARSSISITGTSNTTSLGGRSEWIQEPTGTRRPRGGREQGSRLSAPIVQNGRQVRQVGGACFRCTALRERCSDGTPCKACRKLKGRKWDGCIRSFHELTDLLDPDILASRLRSQVLTGWIYGNAPIPPCRREFDLPLSFGFGKPFIGFRGVEYDPRTEHALWSYTVGQSETHPQSVQFSRSLPVCPVNSSSIDVQKKVWRWLKQTLWSNESMEDWLYTCFPGSRAEWIRELLRVVWGYSIDCWNEGRRNEGRLQEVDKNLFEAWMACLIVTILSLPITVPESEIDKIVRHLEFARDYSGPYSNTSRALAKCVKSLLFDMYQQFVQGVTQALDRYDQLRTDDITDRYLCHMNCIAILIMVITCQIQTSLMDNYQISHRLNEPEIWEETLDQVTRVEGVFKNTVLFVRYRSKEWQNKKPAQEYGAPRLSALRHAIQEIGWTHGDAIKRHLNVKLDRFKDPNVAFHKPNMQRVFAFFFDLECRFRRTR